MAIKQRSIILVSKDTDGNTTMDFPLTNIENVEGLDERLSNLDIGSITEDEISNILDGVDTSRPEPSILKSEVLGMINKALDDIVIEGNVKTVNNIKPDENGNIDIVIEGNVKTVNNTEPDENGNISINIPSAYVHPTTAGNKHIPAGGSQGQYLRWSADGVAVWDALNVPLVNDSRNGLMASSDKVKLDMISINSEGHLVLPSGTELW